MSTQLNENCGQGPKRQSIEASARSQSTRRLLRLCRVAGSPLVAPDAPDTVASYLVRCREAGQARRLVQVGVALAAVPEQHDARAGSLPPALAQCWDQPTGVGRFFGYLGGHLVHIHHLDPTDKLDLIKLN